MAPCLTSRTILLGLAAATVFAAPVASQTTPPHSAPRPDAKPSPRAERSRLPAGWSKRTQPAGLWLGQDGRDFVGPSSALAPSDVQDIHVALAGLPAERRVESGAVKGLGGDEWAINGPYGPWKGELVREPGATTADLYLEPSRVETGRPFTVLLRLDDGRSIEIAVSGGKADPNLRMPQAALKARWVGQDRQDRVGTGPSVGPDGVQDVHLVLERLSPRVEVAKVTISLDGKSEWQSGVNPEMLGTAELARRSDDPSTADLYFQPGRHLSGKSLRLGVSYANSKTDAAMLKAGRFDPGLRMPTDKLPPVSLVELGARWLGQDGSRKEGRGDVHVAIEGLPTGRTVLAAALSDAVGGYWLHRAHESVHVQVEPFQRPLGLHRSPDGKRADLYFSPERNESGAKMTLRLVYEGGQATVAQFPGGACDVTLRAPALASREVKASPGDDLHALVEQGGTVTLARGTYKLDRPLSLPWPTHFSAEPGTTLEFSQKPGAPTWSAAIKIHAGRTTLEGFAVRFATPIRWTPDTSFGPAVIGSTDNHDKGQHDPKVAVTIKNLDLESPPASGRWEEAPRLLRLATAASGKVEGCNLKGGLSEFLNGPWEIVNNEYSGTVPNTFSYAVFSIHHSHDVVVRGNRAAPSGPSGKTWRFLVMTDQGAADVIAENKVVGIGPMDNDTVPGDNAPEIILTESYRLHFEGRPAAISPDGRVLKIPAPQGDPARSGDVVAILSGPHAGEWRRIAQAIDPTTYLMESPLPTGDCAISIASGFVEETFRDNTIDARGSSVAVNLFLAGNHFGTKVLGNRLLGADGFRIVSPPSEQPVHWGWSHAPVFGALVQGNTLEDCWKGATMGVEHGPNMKSSQGRVYMTATLNDTVVKWSDDFLARRRSGTVSEGPIGINVGEPGAREPAEFVLTEQGNRVEVAGGIRPTSALRVRAATINGRATAERAVDRPKR